MVEHSQHSEPTPLRRKIQWLGLVLGPVAAVIGMILLPLEYETTQTLKSGMATNTVDFSHAGRVTLAVMIWMSIWWLTEAVHVSVTALLPIAVFPIVGAGDINAACAPYANPLIFLFMGGFLFSLAMERWGLGKRIALTTLRAVGTGPSQMIAGFMLVTAVLSAFMSNTATTAMMLPIAISVIAMVRQSSPSDLEDRETMVASFGTCLMLGIAYAASIGGIATIIGTPPNVFLAGFLKDTIAEPYQMELSFARWLMIGVPFSLVLLPLTFVMLTRVLLPVRLPRIVGGKRLIANNLKELGRPNAGEWITCLLFLVTVTLWMTSPLLKQIAVSNQQQSQFVIHPFMGLSDAGIIIATSLLLFVIPVSIRKREFVMDWKTATRLPWGILILFGGGLSLASAVTRNGVAEFLGSLAVFARDLPPVVVVLIVVAGVVFLTELTSNTATTAALLPVLAALAPKFGIEPLLLVIPAAIAASCAFMLPVATPPNAIVFGSGEVTLPQMVKAGVWLNLISILVIVVLTFLLVKPLLGYWS